MRALLAVFAAAATLLSRQAIRLGDVPDELRPMLGVAGAGSFEGFLARIGRETRKRLQAGEDEHLIYFVLQSGAFTKRPRVEPALSARQFIEQGGVPPEARGRMEDFLAALRRPTKDKRLAYWKTGSLAGLTAAYGRAMRFLYEKEFRTAPGEVGGLYQKRGYSTDSDVEVNYTVSTALAVIRALDPEARLERVLIVGPGLDFAPRTGFSDEAPPQSHEPYLTADSLLRWGLAAPERLEIHCVDINPRVVDFIERFGRSASPVLWLPRRSGDPDYREFFEEAGRRIGAVEEQRSGHRVRIRKQAAAAVRAERMNIVTERYSPSPEFDLAVVTNVLLYFPAPELALALANIHSMIRPGGYLIHNDLRPEAEAIARALSLPPIQGRSLQMAQGPKRPLLDAFVIHRKNR